MIIKKTAVFLLFVLFISVFPVSAQTENEKSTPAFDSTGLPQWVKDLRRWEIVAFGSFPFTMLVATTVMDLYRWNNFNGMGFDDMRYAPWPLKSAGAVSMTNDEMSTTIKFAIGLSMAVAVADLIIVKVKQQKAQKRAEALPVGTMIITREPRLGEPELPETEIEDPRFEDPGLDTDEPDPGEDALPLDA